MAKRDAENKETPEEFAERMQRLLDEEGIVLDVPLEEASRNFDMLVKRLLSTPPDPRKQQPGQ